ncbi:MAG: hypothetical protein NZZ41_02215 [Candidatus Dojkabacteria bacterium]|nr:hypothetical protein [Candidatus Dojkabacteria bacterium]
MKKILLTSINPYCTYREVISHMKKVGANILVDNIGAPPYEEFELVDIPVVWEILRERLFIYLARRN